MIYVGTKEQFYGLEQIIMDNYKFSSLNLIAKAATSLLPFLSSKPRKYLIFVGWGNNGAQGLALAQLIVKKNLGNNVKVVFCAPKLDFVARQTAANKHLTNLIIQQQKIDICYLDNSEYHEWLIECEEIIDCIFGLSFEGDMPENSQELITDINKSSKPILACDIPSGIVNDKENIPTVAIKATRTVTFFIYKTAFINYQIIPFLGKVYLTSLDFDQEKINEFCSEIIDNKIFVVNDVKIEPRPLVTNKGNYGKIMLFGSNNDYLNAGTIAANMAIQAGAGHLTWVIPQELRNYLVNTVLEMTYCDASDRSKILDLLEKVINVVIFGPGTGRTERTLNLLKLVLDNYEGRIVIDADGINVLTPELLRKLKNRAIITPHPQEFARLINKRLEIVLSERVALAKELANKYKIIVILKGYQTIITDGDLTYINSTGNPYMATPGMGDALTGLIASLCGQGYSNLMASYLGVYLHGFCGDLVAQTKKPVLATDVVNKIGNVIAQIINSSY
ncbi:bifunctional ADP-dependent NAD(P)H-hydrate dehydratase/NAD(P)H-hydrate epimerase [Spiroplasma chrysopicola]|uniref:ADP-dependent (S)-NAD(P)H-hydrate dehydratase n=1 Tax=Spiroplasma chrysopicola DF-1 TaxID=1276227 RepID=R4U3Y2_9MOLU|nr:bifunctional ADP-dependent NAD(P)H-hydrate dehydratase/NAD(P)H-hydrate epimerase [Spiroplasma chrysopicola]AGM25238.1 carbohydrate kinase [Spiroplasma chrysopicola DF-1]